MKKVNIILLINIFFLGLLSYHNKHANGKIYKKVHKDGTVEYYNVKKRHKYRKKTFKKRKFPDKYDYLINEFCAIEGVDPYLIKCIIKVESDFVPDAVSVAGAMGLMQLMQATARYYNLTDPLNPEENLRAGIKHFNSLLKYFKNDIPLALAAYHAGLGRVKRKMAIPPIKSTIKYVDRIMYYYKGKKASRSHSSKIKRLYKRIDKHGDIIIYSK